MCAPKATYIHDGPGLNGEFDASIGWLTTSKQ
jgi:hypothetical protein